MNLKDMLYGWAVVWAVFAIAILGRTVVGWTLRPGADRRCSVWLGKLRKQSGQIAATSCFQLLRVFRLWRQLFIL
jgi:hypothetical protein